MFFNIKLADPKTLEEQQSCIREQGLVTPRPHYQMCRWEWFEILRVWWIKEGNVTKSKEIKVEINADESSIKREISWSNICINAWI
jgi:hypothetical protein